MSFDKDKLSLVDYFFKQEKYNVYKNKPRGNNNVYLYKVDSKEFQIIKIIDDFSGEFKEYVSVDEVVQDLKAFLNKKFQRVKLSILSVVLIENRSQVYKEDNGDVVLFVDSHNYLDRLSNYYPKITMLEDNNDDSSMAGMSPEEILDGIKDPNSKLTKNLKQLSDKLSVNNLGVTWVLIALLLIIPIVGIFFGAQIFNTKDLSANATALVYGGITRDLLIWSNQWWRLWTYILFFGNPFLVVFNLFMIFSVARYSEALLGRWRLAIILIFGVPLAGLFLAAVLPNWIFGGSTILLAILWGALFSYNYGKDDLGALIANQRTLVVVMWLLLMPLFLGYSYYLINFVGFFAGSAIGYCLEFNRTNRINWTMLYPVLVVVVMIAVIAVTLSWRRYVPPYNVDVIDALISYYRAGLVRRGSIENMLGNYYFYPKNNWPNFLTSNQQTTKDIINMFGMVLWHR
ncbi:rhomboid family intramembrane serine protease [Spiroplasma poulsonii]|uniref:Rhomboid family intramembrane serine protease n=1 Tax=Spiroplasma poulsonii TaxID=2138 RepID=A0A3S0TYB3_9MOLU|nr:rhomboid family intramembrane serine protease [Spiroplasma poulsonii]MBW3058445.1 rhomboid family intramembrane serine protease [Spiroplasma poulsonii]RUP77456.1 rhomboid family intramembrane serine protease [Spiroplasma poulsonii]